MANLYTGKPRRRIQRALRAVNRFLERDQVAVNTTKTTSLTTRAQFIPADDTVNFDRIYAIKQRYENCLAMQI